tara:strand:- start:1249 stop:2274 length:1026 start_codon:yes stop_codon:yes gene_type:complete
MKRTNLIILALILLTQVSFAKDDFSRQAEFKKRKLLVVLYEEDASTISELSGDALKQYKDGIKLYNKNVTASFKNNWADKPSDFIRMSEVEAFSNDKIEEYSILTAGIKTREKIDFYVFTLNIIYSKSNKKGKKKYFNSTKRFNVNLKSTIPSLADLLFLTTKMKTYFGSEKVFDRNNLEELLKTKTLLIDENTTKLTKAEIKENYPFPFKVTTTNDIAQLSESKDKNSLYFRIDIVKIDKMILVNFIVTDCESGRMLARCHMGGLTKVSFNAPSNNHLKNQAFFDAAAGRPNSYAGTGFGLVGPELARIYTKKVSLKKNILKIISSEKKQLKSFKKLMIY